MIYGCCKVLSVFSYAADENPTVMNVWASTNGGTSWSAVDGDLPGMNGKAITEKLLQNASAKQRWQL